MPVRSPRGRRCPAMRTPRPCCSPVSAGVPDQGQGPFTPCQPSASPGPAGMPPRADGAWWFRHGRESGVQNRMIRTHPRNRIATLLQQIFAIRSLVLSSICNAVSRSLVTASTRDPPYLGGYRIRFAAQVMCSDRRDLCAAVAANDATPRRPENSHLRRPPRRGRPLSGRRQRTSRAGHSGDAGPGACAGHPRR